MDQKRAVIVGHNFTSILGLARALGREGYTINALRTWCPQKKGLKSLGLKPESKSKYIKRYLSIDGTDNDEVMRVLTKEYADENTKAVLIPVDDVCAIILDKNIEELQKYYYLPNINGQAGEITRLMDKGYQKEYASKYGIPVVKDWIICTAPNDSIIPPDLEYPCFVKAAIPVRNRKSIMGKCVNQQELESALKRASECRVEKVIVEPYIEIKEEYCIVGLCNKDRVCIPDIIDEMIIGHGAHAGVTCFGLVQKPELFPDFFNSLKGFLSSLNFQGLFTVDMLTTEQGVYFCEMNMRIGGSGTAVINAGVNLAVMFAEALRQNINIDYNQTCQKKTFASERPLMNDYSLGYISWSQYKKYMRSADIRFIYAPDDKKPYYNYGLFAIRQMIKRTIKNKKYK